MSEWISPETETVQRAADRLYEEMTKLDAPISYTACIVLVKQMLGLTQSPDRVRKLEAENAALRAFAESFHVTVVDNFYQDVTLVLEQPHTLAIRLQNDSTKSWIFADLEARRKAALAQGPNTSTLCPVKSQKWNPHQPCPTCGALGPWFENPLIGECVEQSSIVRGDK